MRSSRLFALVAMLGALVVGAPAGALPDDRDQAIEIRAREAVREEKKGLTVYEGNVTIRQGSILIRADKVSVYVEEGKVSRIEAVGQPAHYQQQPEPDSGLIIARARTIEYRLNNDFIHLVGEANLEQEEATLSGERIDYDLEEEVIHARGGDNGEDERIRMVIPPSQQETP